MARVNLLPNRVFVSPILQRTDNNMGMSLLTVLVPLTYLHFGRSTVIVVKQPPQTISRTVSTQRLGQPPYLNQHFQNTDNVFGINTGNQQWSQSMGRNNGVRITRQRPTQTWISGPPRVRSRWSQSHVSQSEWVPIESIPKSNNPSEWIHSGNIPPQNQYIPDVTSPKSLHNRRRQILSTPSKTKRRKQFSTRNNRKRQMSEDEALNLMEKYVNKKLALEEKRLSETEQTTKEPTPQPKVAEPSPTDALPPALDFLSGRQFGSSTGTKSRDTFMQDPYKDVQNETRHQQQTPPASPKNSPSFVPIPVTTKPNDFYTDAYKALTDVFRMAEAAALKDVNTTPSVIQQFQDNNESNSTNTGDNTPTNFEFKTDAMSTTDTLMNDFLSLKGSLDFLGIDGHSAHFTTPDNIPNPETESFTKPEEVPSIQFTTPENIPIPEIESLIKPEELPKGDNQTFSDLPMYSLEGEGATTTNDTLNIEPVTKPTITIDISTQETSVHDKPMSHSIDNLKVNKIEKPAQTKSQLQDETVIEQLESVLNAKPKQWANDIPEQIPLPPQEKPLESTTEKPREREIRPFYDIFGGRRQQQEIGSLDLFSSEPPVDSNHPFSKRFRSSTYQPFEIQSTQINTNGGMIHGDPSFHHPPNPQPTQKPPHPPYHQRHYQNIDQQPYPDHQGDTRYYQPLEIPYPDNNQNGFKRRQPRPQQQEIHHIEISIPTTDGGWEHHHSSSIYGIDPSETRPTQYDTHPVEQHTFERRRGPNSYNGQTTGQTSSYNGASSWGQSSWTNPEGTQNAPYVNERHNPDPYAPDYMRRSRPSLSHFERPEAGMTGQQREPLSNSIPAQYNVGDVTKTTTEEPPSEFRSNNHNQADPWPQSQTHGSSHGGWSSHPGPQGSTGWGGRETHSNGGWERRDNRRANSWQQNAPTEIWTSHNTGYDAQGEYNQQNGMQEYNHQNEYGQENTQYGNNEGGNQQWNNGYNDYPTQEGYNNGQVIDYTDGEGNGGGNDDSDEDDR
ncbi:uncharacterized protein [Argopecten irradians]|uniref:uncharacterized protein n=1 Tax=Argopecten irradians TaxID=31199 RepID=UPI00371A4365